MVSTVEINDDIKEKLKIRSSKTGTNQLDLVNKYVSNGLKADEDSIGLNFEDIGKLLSYDNPSGKSSLEEAIGSVD